MQLFADYKVVKDWMRRGFLIVMSAPFLVSNFRLAVSLFLLASFIWMCFDALERFDRIVPGPRWVSHTILYLLWVGYVFIIYRFVSPWAFAAVTQIADAGNNPSAFKEIAQDVLLDFRNTLEGYVSPQTIDRAAALGTEFFLSHKVEIALKALDVSKSLATLVTFGLLIAIFFPLLLISLHSSREKQEAGASYIFATLLDGKNGNLYKYFATVWDDYIFYGRGIFRAMFWVGLIMSFLYAADLLLFKKYFGGNIGNAALAGYSFLLGFIGAFPVIGGFSNWITISYVGGTAYGLSKTFVYLFASQILLHKLETWGLTPKFLGESMEIPMLGQIGVYAMSIGIFGANILGFVAALFLMPLVKAIICDREKAEEIKDELQPVTA